MIQSLSEARWFKVTLFSLAIVFAVIAWVYGTGAIFLEFAGYSMEDVTFLTAYQYWYHYGTDPATQQWLTISAVLAAIMVAAPVIVFFMPKPRSLYGDAKWAKAHDIRKAGLYGDQGIIIGKHRGQYLMFGGSEHVLLAAPTRSGKGVGVIIPNMLNWSDSAVVLDIKQENWDITAGFRAEHGQECYLFNPASRDYKTHRWNPLFYINEDKNLRINDIQKIANMLWPDAQGQDPIWNASSRSLFLALVLYLLETDDLPVTMGEVFRQITQGQDTRFADILQEREDEGNPLSPICVSAFNDYLDISDKTRTSIRKTFTSTLELWQNPLIDATTCENDFDLRDLRKKRMSIYVSITPDDLERMPRIINLFFQQLIDLNTRELPSQNKELKHQVLLVMDEFPAIERVKPLEKGIAYIAGYGLRMLTIVQSPGQLEGTYRESARSLVENHACNIVYATKNQKTAKEISEELGDTTVNGKSKTKSLTGQSSRSETISEQRRALLLPQEIKHIGKWKEIILIDGAPPIMCTKIRYFNDKNFTSRLRKAPTLPVIKPVEMKTVKIIDISSADTEIIERAVTEDDISNIDNMDLDAFSCDFSDVNIPKGKASQDVMNQMQEMFFGAIEMDDSDSEMERLANAI